MGKIKHLSVDPNNIFISSSAMVIETDDPIESPDLISIRIGKDAGRISVEKNNQIIKWYPTQEIQEGRNNLQIRNLKFSDGSIIKNTKIPLTVINSNCQIPSEARILYFSRIGIKDDKPRRLTIGQKPEFYIEVFKILNNKDKALSLKAFDITGNEIDLQKFYLQFRKQDQTNLKKAAPSLKEKLKVEANDKLPVAIWLYPKEKAPRRSLNYSQEQIQRHKNYTKILSDQATRFAEYIRTKYRIEITKVDKLAPIVYAKLSKKEIEVLDNEKEVAKFFLWPRKTKSDLCGQRAIHRTLELDLSGINGNGIRVGVIEAEDDGSDPFQQNLDILGTNHFYQNLAGHPIASHHAFVASLLKHNSIDNCRGHATACEIFMGNYTQLSSNNGEEEAVAWAVLDNECTVINNSEHIEGSGNEEGEDHLDYYYDHLTQGDWPFPTVVRPAGNYDPAEHKQQIDSTFVENKSYNSLIVGNHDKNNPNIMMAPDSLFFNPWTPDAGSDRELPDITACGTDITNIGNTWSGTSFAAPVVSATAALIQQVNPLLKHAPEATRAIILASALKNVDQQRWWDDVDYGIDGRDGSGSVDASIASRIAAQTVPTYNKGLNFFLNTKGWNWFILAETCEDDLFETDLNLNTALSKFYWRIHVPQFVPSTSVQVKICLTWTREVLKFPKGPTGTLFPQNPINLDLELYDDDEPIILVRNSSSIDNNYEIIDFLSPQNRNYRIYIRIIGNIQDQNTIEMIDGTYVGLAWYVHSYAQATEAGAPG